MTKEIISFLKPRLALLLAAAMLISMMPVSAFAAETTAAETTWESQVTGSFIEAASALESYTHYSVVDGEAVPETVTIDTTATLGSKENPIAISSPEELILFGQAAANAYSYSEASNPTYGKYYILTQASYDMGGHSMLALSASAFFPSGTVSYFGFYGTLIGNGATIRNAYIVDGTRTMNGSNKKIQPALFSALNGRIWDLTMEACTVSGGSGGMGMLYAATNGLAEDAIINCNVIDGQILPGSDISTITLLGSPSVNSQADVTLGCDYTLRSNLTLNSGEILTIPEGVTLTVPAGRTLTLGSGTSLINNGKLVLAEGGSIVNNGGTATCGESSGHAYLEGVCQLCGNVCAHTGDATCAEQATCPQCGQVYQPAHTPNEAGDACDVCGVAMYRVSKYEEDDRLRFLLFQGPDYAFEGQDYVGRIIVDPDYGVTESTDFNFEVWVDGVQITEYRFCNTVLTVPAHLVTGDILITCDGDLQKEPDTPLGSCPGIIGGSLSHDGFVWAADYSSCTIRACCGLCDEIFEYTHTPGVTTTEATCVAPGKTVYSVSFRDLSDSKEVILPIDESNHDYVDSVCSRCGEKLHPIFLGGVQISDDNASDILGDGTASYDAQTGTLTLNGTTVDASALGVPALEITGGTVTLALQGTNALTGSVQVQSATDEEGNTTWYGESAISIAEGAALIITGDEAATLTLMGNDFAYTANDHIPGASSISGGSLTVAGGTITTNNGICLTGDYSQTGGSVDAGFLEAQNVTVSDGILNTKAYSGIYPRYADSLAGSIHGIIANKAINISGGTVSTASGSVGHNGDYCGNTRVTGETITTHGLYALESVSITGGTVTSTGCVGGYVIDAFGFLGLGQYTEDDVTPSGPAPGAALEAPEWTIAEEATFICGSETSHRGGTATCTLGAICDFCGASYGETDTSNHDTVNAQYTNGFCDVCGIYEAPELVDDVYQIGNAGELYWFAELVNGGNSAINGKLTADIVVSENVLDENGDLNGDGSNFRAWTPIGYYVSDDDQVYYTGILDGDNHTISGLYFNDSSTEYIGLFGYVGEGGIVQDVGVVDSYFNGSLRVGSVIGKNIGTVTNCYNTGSINGKLNIGGVVGVNSRTGTVENCYNIGTVSGDSYVGGVVGFNYDNITNCYNAGIVSGENYYIGGIAGYQYEGTVENCYNIGTVSGDSYVGGVVPSTVHVGTVTNCYYLDTCGASGTGTIKTAEQFASGEVAYLLNAGVTDGTQVWYQTIGTDVNPGFTGGTVYYGYEGCYDTDTDYSNDVRYVTIPTHVYSDNGFCTVCGSTQGATRNDQGIYEIGNAGQLMWFAKFVNLGNKDVDAILAADIDMGGIDWTPICSTALYYSANPAADGDWGYTGSFDGQGHEISNLSLIGSDTETLSYGLFGTVSGTVKNLGMKNFSFVDGGKDCRAGSIVGQLLGGTITDCYAVDCTLDVTEGTSGYIAGGLAGCNYAGTIENCFVMNCTVRGHSRCAALVADCRGDASTSDRPGTVKNCYSDSTLAGSQKVASYIIDCESYVIATRFSGGEIAIALGDAWGQTIGTDAHPVVGGPAVYKNTCGDGFFYANDDTDHDEHAMDGITCSLCGNYQAAQLITEDNYATLGVDASHVGAYAISNVSQLYWYAALTNGMLSGVPMDYYASGVLLADLDLEGRDWIPVGLYEETIDGIYLSTCWGSDNVWDDVNQRYTTYFDGRGHTISNFNAVGENSQGLFGYIYCASIMNLTVKNATASGWNAGAIAGYPYGCSIENCSAIGCTISGETATEDSTDSIVGAMTGSPYGYLYNSFAYDCTVLRTRAEDYLYALGGLEDDGYAYNSVYSKVRFGYVGDETLSDFTYGWYMSEEDMASGYVAYWLRQGYSEENYTVSGDIWGQILGTDACPVLGGPAVYQVLDCDGVTEIFSNTNENKSHSYNEYGCCTVCETECVHTPDETTGNCASCHNFIVAKGVVAVQCQEGEASEPGYEDGYRSGIRYFVNINEALSWGCSELYLYRDDYYSGEFTLNDTTHMADPQVKLYLNGHTLTLAEGLGVYVGYDWEIIDGTLTGSYDGALLRPYLGTYELVLNGVILVNEQGDALSNGCEYGGSWKITLQGGSVLQGTVADVYYSGAEQGSLVFGDSYTGEPITFALAEGVTAENFVLATAAEGVMVDRSWIADNDTTDELYVLRDAENNQLYLGACVEATHEWDWVQLETTHERTCSICGLYESANHADEVADHFCDTCGKQLSDHEIQEEAEWYLHEDSCYVNLTASCPGCDITVYDSGDATLTGSYEGTNCQDPSTVTYSFTYTFDGTEYTVTETLKTGTDPHTVFDGNGFCTSCGGYQKPTVDPGEDAEWDYDDVYLIYNAGQLFWFADYVNNVNNNVTGKLMTDIDLNPGYTFHGDGTYTGGDSPRMWTPIGTGYPCYAGSFDGNGFAVSGAYAVSEGSYVGLFGNTDYNYTIENLGITNSYFKGADHVGGLIGYAYTTVKNCYVTDTVYVSGDYDTAAFIGYNGGEITNCYAMADTFVASSYGSCYNCYAMTEGEGTTALTAEDFISGKAAYLLQSGVAEDGYYDENDNWVTFIPEIWGQSIGTDSYPVLKGAKVYQVTNCKDETVYSNTDENIEHIPVEDDGDCTTPVNCSVCGDVLIAAKADHDLSYTKNGDGHSYTCSNCNVAATEAHSYTNFLCACGMVSPDAVATVVSGDGAMYFATFADALSAWTDGTTLQLLQNVEYAETITVTGKRVLDLNGKVIHCQRPDSNKWFYLFYIEGDLTIQDSGENGTITLRGSNYASVIASVGNLTIESGHIDGQHWGVWCEGGTLNISGGTVSAYYAVDLKNTEATVSNGKIQGYNAAVDVEDGASLVVTGGEISASSTAIQVGQNTKSAVISGGSLSGTGYGVECYGNVTISGNVVIDAELADFCFSKAFPDARVIIDCPLADGSYTVKMDVPGAFGVAGEGITLNPKAFTAYNTNHKIVEDDAGLAMVLCDHSNGIDADGACLDCGKISQFNILVDGVIITTANMSDVLGDGTVSYDSATNTLILNNAKIEDAVYTDGDASMGLGILAQEDLNIRLVGDNFISSGASEYMSVAILCYGNLTITGNGTLIAQCGQAQEMLSIVATESLCVDANVSVTVSDFAQCSSYSMLGQFNGILKVGFGPYDYVACGNAVLSRDLTVNGNNDTATMEHIGEFTVLEGATLTIADGVTLTIADNSELASAEVNNILTNKGKVILEGSGTIVNLGEGICTETATHCFDSESKCLICGYTCSHSWLDATCTAPKTCTVCGATEGEALGHTEKTVPGYDATCTKSGLTDGVICSVCGEILTAQTAIPTTAHSWVTACTKPKTCSVCGETQGPVLPHNGYEYDGVCDYCGVVAVRVKLEDTGTEYFAFAEAGEDLDISVPESEYQLYCWVADTRTGEDIAEGFVKQDGTFTVSGAYLDGSRVVCVEVDPVYVGIVNLNGGSIIDENKKVLEAAGLKCTETYHERVYYIRYSASNLYTGMYIREGYTLVGYELDGVVYGLKDYFTASGDNFVIDLIWECDHQWKDATCTAPKTCTVCGETEGETLGHSYENNVCTVCGQENVPVKLDSASLSFKEKIHYNIFFSLELDETVDLSDMGLVMFDSLNADGTVDDAIAIYSGAVEVDGKYMIATDGVHAKRMGDTIYFRVYAKLADGSYVYSKTVQYSAVTYAEHILAGDQPESAKALVVAMLNYGAAAQKFFGYNTDNLVNAFLTEEQKALPEQYRDDMVNTVPVVAAEKQGIFANNKGFSKRVPAVSFEGAFEINYFFTPAYAPVDGITLYYWTEADFEANEVLTVDNATGSIRLEGTGTEQYRGDIGGIAAKNLSGNIYVAAIYSDGTTTWTSGVLGYSIGAYCGRLAAKGGTMADLAMATAVYGYHAKQYFG